MIGGVSKSKMKKMNKQKKKKKKWRRRRRRRRLLWPGCRGGLPDRMSRLKSKKVGGRGEGKA